MQHPSTAAGDHVDVENAVRKPLLLILLASGLLGVMCTVAIAWGVAAFADLEAPGRITFQPMRLPDDRVVNMLRSRYTGAEVIAARVHEDHSIPRGVGDPELALIRAIDGEKRDDVEFLAIVERLDVLDLPPGSGALRWADRLLDQSANATPPEDRYCVEQRFGWPWATMYTMLRPTTGFTGWERIDGIRWRSLNDRANVAPSFLPKERILPTIPAPGPFVASVLMFGGAWYAVFITLRSVMVMIRRKRGRCPECGYDLRHRPESGCSECGWNRPESPEAGDDAPPAAPSDVE